MTGIALPPQIDVSLDIKIDVFQKQCRKKLDSSMWRLNSTIDFIDLQTTITNAVQTELSKAKNSVYVRSDAYFIANESGLQSRTTTRR